MIELLNCDCMDYMKDIPDKYFDLAIVDPPYGINAPNMSATPCQRKNGNKRLNGGAGKLKHRILNVSNCDWDNEIPDSNYFDELYRISINQIIWGGNYFGLPSNRCFICWDKQQPWENFSQVEYAWTSFNKPAKLYKYDNRTGDKIHPTQKPIQLYKWTLRDFATSNMKIIDTHLGSGSSAIAAYDFGIAEFVGTEIDKDYYDAAVKRFEIHKMQQKLF